MLNEKVLMNRVFEYLKDDPHGNGTYSLEEMKYIIEISTRKFLEESQAIIRKTTINNGVTWLRGLNRIKHFEDSYKRILERVEYEVVGEQVHLLRLTNAVVVWTYSGYEVINNQELIHSLQDIKFTLGCNTQATQSIINYSLQYIFEQENELNKAQYFEVRAKEIAKKIRRNHNSSYQEKYIKDF